MVLDVQTLIEQKPHLKSPLEVYDKWQHFHREVLAFLKERKPFLAGKTANAYGKEDAQIVYQNFIRIFGLPEERFQSLGEALSNGDIDFLKLSLDELPQLSGLTCSADETRGLLFLISRPYFLALRDSYPQDGSRWEHGRCPLCSAKVALATVIEGPVRQLHCSFCGTQGPYRFLGCPHCDTDDPEKLHTIASDDEPGFRISTCDHCQTYIKVVESTILAKMPFDLADMVSLPLDILAQKKGYARMAPNPISLKKMV